MSTEKLIKTFHLKKVIVTPAANTNFKVMLLDAWHRLPKARDRIHKISSDSDENRVMNDLVELGLDKSAIAAPIFAFTLNANQNAVTINNNAKSFDVETLAPRRDSKKHQEFIEGLVYIAVKKDFIAIMANKALSFQTLEDYFNWLLNTATGQTLSVKLVDPPKPDLKSYNMSDVKSVIFSSHVMTGQERNSSGTRTKVRTFGTAIETIKDLINALGASPLDFHPESVGDYDNLEVSVVMRYLKRGNYHNASIAVRKIAESFRDLDNPPISFEFGDGRKLDAASFRVSATQGVSCENKIPKATEVIRLLWEWLQKQVTHIENQK